jgi:hypothetical protein
MTTTKPLSPRMRELVEFVRDYSAVHHYPPSMADAAEYLGINRTVALKYAKECAARGALAYDIKTARSWRVVDLAAIGEATKAAPASKRRRRR